MRRKHFCRMLFTISVKVNNYQKVLNIGFFLALIMHLSFIFLFGWLGVKTLAVFNIFSSTAYIICLLINSRGYFTAARILAGFEILLHSCLAVVFLGWESGFHYYIICLVLMLFLSQVKNMTAKTSFGVFLFLSYIALHAYSLKSQPLAMLSPQIINTMDYLNMLSALMIIAYFAHLYSKAVNNAEQRLHRVNRKLELIAGTDPLTKIANRRKILRDIKSEVESIKKSGNQLTLILADIDDFKLINDQYSHECGDFVLRSIADLIRKNVGNQGKVARWGGEEFLIVLPEIGLEKSRCLAETVKNEIEKARFNYHDNLISVTMTFGITVYLKDISLSACIGNADSALRDGKKSGKNCVMVF